MAGAGQFVRLFVCIACSASMAIAAGRPAPAGGARPSPRAANTAAVLRQAVKQLIDEAQKAMREQELPTESADFAGRFTKELPGETVLKTLTQRAHSHPFVDAYVRWQLTSFNPELPSADVKVVAALLEAAPPMVENPRAETSIVDMFRRAEQAARLSEQELQSLRAAAEELDRRAKVAEAFNAAALGWRAWAVSRLGDSAAVRLHFTAERCAATVAAGWPSRAVKAQMTKECKQAAGDATVTGGHRQLLAEQLKRMSGKRRMAVDQITFLAAGGVNVSFTTAAVSQEDTDRWLRLLDGKE